MTVTEAARNFADVVNRAYYRHEATLLLKNGAPVARIVPVTNIKTGKELAEILPALPHLTPEDAIAFENELADSKSKLLPPISPWE